MMKKAVPIVLMIVGVAILIGIGLFVLDRSTSAEPDGLGTWIFAVLGLLIGASVGIKGWLDWNKKETPSQVTENVARDGGQLATGDSGRNVQTKDSSQYIEKIDKYYEAPKAEFPLIHPLHQLPQPPADFTGRNELIDQLLADLKHGEGATITGKAIQGLIGMGGIGKTVIGLVVAHQVAKDYPDAQIFLDLRGTTSPLSAMDIMRHVILSFEPTADLRAVDEANMLNAYRSVLHEKHVLLFFDNARSAEQITPLRPPETCAMLVTSRWNFPVPGLHSRRLDLMDEADAKAFLLELCPRIGEKAHELAKACAWLPLALRIAGSFLQVNEGWDVEKYIAQLNDHKGRLDALKRSHADAELKTEPELLATFEGSYNQLSEEDRKRWRMLGVFPVSFDANAAKAMWEVDDQRTLRLLSLLARYSLLDHHKNTDRYALHDLLADYALSQMEEGEEFKAHLRHVSHYVEILAIADNWYMDGGENIVTGLRLFDQEWENIRTGQVWVVSKKTENPIASTLCFVFTNAGAYILEFRQHPRERIHWLEAALFGVREIGGRYEGAVLGNLGNAYADLGETHKAIEFYERALIILHEVGERMLEGKILSNLGSAYLELDQTYAAIEFFEQSVVIKREIGDRRGEASALGNLGKTYSDLGETRKAIEFHEQALVIDRETGDRRGEGKDLANLGIAYTDLGEAHKAIEFHEQAFVIHREIGDRRGEGQILGCLGNVYADLGETRKAIEFYEQWLVITREIGDRRGEGNALGDLGNAYYSLGEINKAIEFYEAQLVIAREIGDRRGEGNALGNLGVAYADLGEINKAIEFYEGQLAITRELGDRRGEGITLYNMGLALYELEEKDRAIDLMKQALEIYEAIESPNAEKARNQLKEWGALQTDEE